MSEESGAPRLPVLKEVPRRIKSQEQLNVAFRVAMENAEKAKFKANSREAMHTLEVYNKIVTDGRFIKEFGKDPGSAAQKLGHELSASEIADIQAALGFTRGAQVADDVELVAIAVIIIIVVAPRLDSSAREIVVDTAGVVKA